MRQTLFTLILLFIGSITIGQTTDNYVQSGAEKYMIGCDSLYKAGKINEAKECFTNSIPIFGETEWVYYNRAIVKTTLKDYDGAINDYNLSITINPQLYLPYIGKAMLQLQIGNDVTGCINNMLTAASIRPDKIEIYFPLLNELIHRQYFQDAGFFIKEALEIDSLNYDIHRYSADLEDEQKHYKDAIAKYNYCIKLNPNRPDAYYLKGLVYNTKGDHKTAIELYSKSIELDSNSQTANNAYRDRAFSNTQLGLYNESLADFKKGLSLNPNDPLGYNNIGYAYLMLNKIKEAFENVNKSLELDPANSYAFKNLSLIYIHEKDYKNACNNLSKARELKFKDYYGNEVDNLIRKYCK